MDRFCKVCKKPLVKLHVRNNTKYCSVKCYRFDRKQNGWFSEKKNINTLSVSRNKNKKKPMGDDEE